MNVAKDRISDFQIYKNRLLKYTGVAQNVILPTGITDIDAHVFASCNNIELIELPAGLEYIGKFAFHNCVHLKELMLPDNVNIIENEAFSFCMQLEKITFSKGIQHIGYGAFMGCENLIEVEIPEGPEHLADSVFQFCSSLEKIIIPDSIKMIGIDSFAVCTALREVHCKKGSIADYYFQMLMRDKINIIYTGISKHPVDLNRFFI